MAFGFRFLLAALIVMACRTAAAENSPDSKRPIIVAHRGASVTHPENTIPAFEESIRLKVDMIEWDVYPTKDGELVIIHDATVDRTTDGKGKVRDLTLAEIKALDAGAWKGEQFKGVRVPTLDEALAILPEWMHLNCHLKLERDEDPDLTLKVIEILRRFDMEGRTLFVTHVPEIVKTAQKEAPEFEPVLLPRGVEGTAYLDQCSEIGTKVLQPHRGLMKPEFVDEMHRRGMVGNVFYANSPEDIRTYIKMGIDGILTDEPAVMVDVLNEIFGPKPGEGS